MNGAKQATQSWRAGVLEEFERLQAERNALLVACKIALQAFIHDREWGIGSPRPTTIQDLKAAIAKAEGKADDGI